jgi:hypothetical protein
LDADDIWLPDKIDLQIDRLKSNPEVGLIYTGVVVVDADLNALQVLRPASGRTALRNTLLVEKPFMTGIGSTGLMPLGIARSIGFDRRLSASADWAFACRVAMAHRVDAIGQPLVLYRQHSPEQIHLNLGVVEQDMCLALDELFRDPLLSPRLRRQSRRAHANLYLSLAASHFKREDHINFLKYLSRASIRRPDRVVAAFWRRYRGPVEGEPTLGLETQPSRQIYEGSISRSKAGN